MAEDIFLLLRFVFCLDPALENGLIIFRYIIFCLGFATVGLDVKREDVLKFWTVTISFSSRASSSAVEGGGVN